MNKYLYTIISTDCDNAIALLSQDYNKKERRWMLNSPEAIEQVQKDIRALKHAKILAWEEYLVDDYGPELPQQIRSMLTPIVTRRKFESQLPAGSIVIRDSARFVFPIATGTMHVAEMTGDAYQPKHLRGFWSCPACMEEVANAKLYQMLPEEEHKKFAIYNKRVQWCPKFILTLAKDKDPQQYDAALKKINPEGNIPYCYAGLLHEEFQTTETEAKRVQYCDTCAYQSIETKQLAEPIDPDNFDVGIALAENRPSLEATCKCKICGAIVFQAPMDQATTRDGNLTPEYEQKLTDHYAKHHPGQ